MIRQLIVVRAADFSFLAKPQGGRPVNPQELFGQVRDKLHELLPGYRKRLGILGIPSLDWEPVLTKTPPRELPPPDRFVIALDIDDAASVEELRQAVEDANNSVDDVAAAPFPGVGADLSLAESEYFCPTSVDELLFGDRADADALTGSQLLQTQGLTGQGVNIVVIDEGFDQNMVQNYGGGLVYLPNTPSTVLPGATMRGHGLMMVRNILAAAPDATFYDVPLIPPRISNVTGFIGDALGAFTELKLLIGFLHSLGIPPWDGPWILVNAWSIFDRTTEYPRGDYTENPHHPLNVVVDEMVGDGFDIVFAAGNCGQFCPDRRCGKLDVGPGSSIFGANSHRRVLTTGAVRTDALWAGSSSEGPGQRCLSQHKPDLCAPSYFREVGDASLGNLSEPYVGDGGSPYIASTGTSAACGVAAGIVGAIRSGWDQYSVPPDKLKYFLNRTARKTEGPNWNERLGHGIISVTAALSELQNIPKS